LFPRPKAKASKTWIWFSMMIQRISRKHIWSELHGVCTMKTVLRLLRFRHVLIAIK
jgi:hypothetical protein